MKSLKQTANSVMFNAVTEGITIIFIMSLADVGFTFKRNDSAEIINIEIIVSIIHELM